MKIYCKALGALAGCCVILLLVLIGCGGGGGSSSDSTDITDSVSGVSNTVEDGEPVGGVSNTIDDTIIGEPVEDDGKSWFHPTSLMDNINPIGDYASIPYVAMANSGDAILVWSQENGNYKRVYKSEYRNGTWSHPSDIDDYINPNDEYPSTIELDIAMNDNGDAIIVWMQEDSSDGPYFKRIYRSEYRNGTWSHPADISDYMSIDGEGQYAAYPKVAMNNNGDAIIVWTQSDGSQNRIYKSEYRDGNWIHPDSVADYISPNGGAGAAYPHVAMDNNGDAIIVWYQESYYSSQIYMSEYRGGNWTHPSDINDYISDVGDVYNPMVAMGDNGNAIVVWRGFAEKGYQVFKSEYRDGNWTHPSDYRDHISPSANQGIINVGDIDLAMDNNGNAIIVWEQFSESDYQVFKSEYRDGNWTHPSDINDYINPQDGVYEGFDDCQPIVAMDDNGSAIIVWQQEDDWIKKQAYKSEYRNGSWIHPSDLSDHINFDSSKSSSHGGVAMDNNGDAIIGWLQGSGGSGGRIFISEYRDDDSSQETNIE